MAKVYASAGETVNVIAKPASGNTITTLGLTFAGSGRKPFAFAQRFVRGDVPAGATVVGDCSAFQWSAWSYYDDGSARDSYVSGYVDNVTANVRANVAMRLGAPMAGPVIALAARPVTIRADGVTLSTFVRQTICDGPVMRLERWSAPLSALVRFIFYTRTFAGGEMEVSPVFAENAGWKTAAQPNRVASVTVAIGNTVLFSESVDIKHHTRIALMRGAKWSTWINGGSDVLPDHEHAYLARCVGVPYVVANATVPNVTTIYPGPNYVGESGSDMNATGYSPRIGILARSNVYYVTTGGRKAFDYMMSEALSAGSWHVHYVDEATGQPPLMSANPSVSWLGGNLPKGSGTTNHAQVVDTSHQPSSCYVAAITTGWPYLVAEHIDWALHNHYYQHASIRQNAKGIIRPDVGANQDRGAAWGLRTLAQAVSICPATHPLLPDLVYAWQSNMQYYRARFVDGTLDGGRYVTPMGVLAPYSPYGTSLYADGNRGTSLAWWGAAWMQSFITQALGHAYELRLPVGAQGQADNLEVFKQSAKLVVGLFGTEWNWRRGGPYAMPFLRDGSKRISDSSNAWLTFAESYAEHCTGKNLQPLDPTAIGATIKRHSTNTDVDITDWTVLHLVKQWPALTYAVMHGVTGATDSISRVMASASWPIIAGAINEPEWGGMMPPGMKHPGAP